MDGKLLGQEITLCPECKYVNKTMIKDKLVCDLLVSTNRKGTVEKNFGCMKGRKENGK